MKKKLLSLVILVCLLLLSSAPGGVLAAARANTDAGSHVGGMTRPASAQDAAAKIPPDQLDSVVAPIALYPDELLAQVLVASTYPLEIVQLQQWLLKNPGLKDQKLVDAVSKQPWDASIQAMAGLPDVVKRLADDIQWTTDLGNAFLAQQTDVMDAVQRMRQKAQGKGSLVSNEQQKVETRTVQSKQVIVIEQANPEVVYVPSYDPVWVYGPPIYPYPSIYYPYYGAGIVAASAISWGIGFAMGAFWGGGWGWGCGWGGGDIDINMNNNFNRNTNIGGGNRTNIGGGNRVNPLGGNRGGGKWQHNPAHRGGAPYRDRATANRFGGSARGDSLANRRSGARQQIGRQGGNMPSAADRMGSGPRGSGAGVSDRMGSGGRGSGGGVSDRAGNRGGGSGFGDRSGGGSGGSRDLSRGSGSRGGGFGGDSGGFSGRSARSSSSRGSSSMSSRGGGGGFSRGGGGGGFSRGGGGGGRGGGGRR
jgi:hypothetical protein